MALLQTLPVEIIQQIATHLEDCKDLLNFSLTCRPIYDAVLATQAVCRELFLKMYDKPPKWEEYDYKKAYWWRRGVLDEFLNAVDTVNRDLPPGEALVKASHLTVQMFAGVEELLLEARDKNFGHLIRFASSSPTLLPWEGYGEILNRINLSVMALQLILTNSAASKHLAWTASKDEPMRAQRWAYGGGERALFAKGGIDEHDLTRLWRTANFFLLHFQGRMEGLESAGLKLSFDQILAEGRGAPGLWEGNLRLSEAEMEMPKYWFGFYVYLEPDDIYQLRTAQIEKPLHDHYDGKISIMELDIQESTFTGQGSDVEPFNVTGVISSLPTISSIPGWRRVSFSNNYPEDRWLYEGCLLPGARTIVGRWTTFDEDEDEDENDGPGTTGWEGPFIMWAVSKEDYELEKGLREGDVNDDDFLNH